MGRQHGRCPGHRCRFAASGPGRPRARCPYHSLAAAVGLGVAARALLYEIKGYDPGVLAGAVVALAAVAITAGIVPALRASRIDPIQALRYE